MNIKEVKEKLQVYDFYDDGNFVYWEYLNHVYYLPRKRYYELREYFQRCFAKIEDERRKEELIRENLSINAHILKEENLPKITVYNIKGHPVYKIEGKMEDEDIIQRTHSPFPSLREEKEKEERNLFLRRILDYTKKMVKKLREGYKP